MAAKKIVFQLLVDNEKEKRKALRRVACLLGIESIAIDMEVKKLTVIGEVDPIALALRLRKHWNAEIMTVGPAN